MLGIYKILNKKTGKFYVGRSRDIFERMKTHCQLIKKGKHGNKKMQDDMIDISLSDLSFEILEICGVSKLKKQEEFWIKELKAIELGYNTFEKDEEFLNAKYGIDQVFAPYLKKAFKNLQPTVNDPIITVIEESTFEFLLKLFSNDMDLLRPKEEILIIPDKFKNFRKPPFIYVYDDFGL